MLESLLAELAGLFAEEGIEPAHDKHRGQRIEASRTAAAAILEVATLVALADGKRTREEQATLEKAALALLSKQERASDALAGAFEVASATRARGEVRTHLRAASAQVPEQRRVELMTYAIKTAVAGGDPQGNQVLTALAEEMNVQPDDLAARVERALAREPPASVPVDLAVSVERALTGE
jgi:hypothetical protein